jgi:hypothetical protein
MEIIGDDKKLRALYSEAKHAGEAATPGFASVWHRAQSRSLARSLKPRRAFKLSFAVVTALLLLTLGSLAVWSMYSPRRTEQQAVKNQSAPGVVKPATVNSPEPPKTDEGVRVAQKTPSAPVETPVRQTVKPRVRRATTQGEAQLLAVNQTTKETTIDTWQSPTAALLSSPTDGLFKSVPQLNENANEMKSVLPGRSNDKEK